MILLAVSYEPSSLNSRKALLESAGHMVVPASTLDAALFAVWQYHYDLLVLGATVPDADRQKIAQDMRSVSPATSILAVGGAPFGYADGVVEAGDADKLLEAIGQLSQSRRPSEQTG